MTNTDPRKWEPSPALTASFDDEIGASFAVGSPRFFEDLEREASIPVEDVQILQRMVQQYGQQQIHELVSTLAK